MACKILVILANPVNTSEHERLSRWIQVVRYTGSGLIWTITKSLQDSVLMSKSKHKVVGERECSVM